MSGGGEPRWSRSDLAAITSRLAKEISADHPDGVILVGVLKGSLFLLADVARALEVDCVIDFLALSRFVEGAARVRILKDLTVDVSGQDVVLLEDIVDTGLSSQYVMSLLESRSARRVSLCALLNRPSRRIVPVEVRYLGGEAGEDFLVGYGLDYAERYRNLAGIYEVSAERLEAEPDSFPDAAYGGSSA